MTDDEKAAKITQLREGLRNGRRASQAGSNISGDGEGTVRTYGSSVKSDGRSDQGVETGNPGAKRVNRRVQADKRSTSSQPVGSGRGGRRSGEGDSGITAIGRGRETRATGRLETDDPIPERQPDAEVPDFDFPEDPSLAKSQRMYYREDYKQSNRSIFGRSQKAYTLISDPSQPGLLPKDWQALPSRKQLQREAERDARTAQNDVEKPDKWHKPSFLGTGKTLSQKEASDLSEPLIAALMSDFEYLDKGLWLYSMSQDEQPIWSDMAREEVEVLANIMLKRGQRSPEAAAAVRAIVDSDVYIQVGAITIPRVLKTYKIVKGSPRPMISKQRREARKKAHDERVRHNVNRA